MAKISRCVNCGLESSSTDAYCGECGSGVMMGIPNDEEREILTQEFHKNLNLEYKEKAQKRRLEEKYGYGESKKGRYKREIYKIIVFLLIFLVIPFLVVVVLDLREAIQMACNDKDSILHALGKC